jgi:DegV family protein with EDD domain
MPSVIVGNLGSNLEPRWYDRFGIKVTPVHMSVDGKLIDTRTFQSTAEIDTVIRSAKKHPHILGTSAAEFMPLLSELQRHYDEIVVVCTSRRTIGTYEAAIAADRTLRTMTTKRAEVRVIDSGTLDLGVGLVTLYVAQAVAAGHRGRELVESAEAVGSAGRFTFAPLSLEYLVRSGRASFLAAQAAELFNRRPLLGMVNGETHKLGTISKSADATAAIADDLVEQFGAGSPVWCGVMHGGNPTEAQRLAHKLRVVFNVRLQIVREISAGPYMSVGQGAVGAYVTPCSAMAWPTFSVDLS